MNDKKILAVFWSIEVLLKRDHLISLMSWHLTIAELSFFWVKENRSLREDILSVFFISNNNNRAWYWMYPSVELNSLSYSSLVDFLATSAEWPFFLYRSICDTTAVLTTCWLLSISAYLKNFSMFCKYCSSMILVSTLSAFALNTSLSVSWTSLVKQLITINTSFSLTLSSYFIKQIKYVRVKFTYFDQHVYKSSQVLVELVALWLWDLEQFSHVEEKLALFVFCKDLSLVQQEDDLVEETDAVFLFEDLVIEDVGLLH